MCSLVWKESIDYYRANCSTTYSVMPDATKAFNHVQYCKLFRKLMPLVNHVFKVYVQWNGYYSNSLTYITLESNAT